jgi:hypothetical protein
MSTNIQRTRRNAARRGYALTPAFKVGDRVHYHRIIGEPHDGKEYEIYAVDPDLGGSGQAVAWLKGKSGCVSMAALSAASSHHQDCTCGAIDCRFCNAFLSSSSTEPNR